jgi:AhpD family alkylhydroperoxidase
MGKLEEFTRFRQKMNEAIITQGNLDIKRFFALDSKVYHDGALDARTKELLGLVASMVLRCDDCISYHVLQAKKHDVTNDELFEVFSVALIVGGSIVIPHLRRAVAFLEELEEKGA